jgi:hypothetical protein
VQRPNPIANPLAVAVSEANSKLAKIPISVCILFSIVTPDHPVDLRSWELIEDTLEPNEEVDQIPEVAPEDRQLARHWSTVFSGTSWFNEIYLLIDHLKQRLTK